MPPKAAPLIFWFVDTRAGCTACAGNNPIMLVGTKVDLLPAGADPAAVAEWLLAAASFKRITAASVHLVGAALA